MSEPPPHSLYPIKWRAVPNGDFNLFKGVSKKLNKIFLIFQEKHNHNPNTCSSLKYFLVQKAYGMCIADFSAPPEKFSVFFSVTT